MSWNRHIAAAAVMLTTIELATADVTQVGEILSDRIPEASGLARSRQPERLWIINDSGSPAVLHAVGIDGALHGEVAVEGVENRDWEDLAAFEADGAGYLVIADVGDNGGLRPFVSLHIVREPDPESVTRVTPLRTIRFRYPNGSQDAESIAVDTAENLVYVLTKRSVPAELYTVPLDADGDEPLVARFVTHLDSLPQPTTAEVRIAPRLMDWFWQPTAMDFSADLKQAAILTYRGLYTYERQGRQSWAEAFAASPAVSALPGVVGAEAVTHTDSGFYVTVEAKRPPLFRVDMPGR